MNDPITDTATNGYRVVHLHNRNDVYHIMRQTILDLVITDETYGFFYNILSLHEEEFNETYKSFAYLVPINMHEANLYLSVDAVSLSHVINFIQTGELEEVIEPNRLTKMVDLATIFGLSHLTSEITNRKTLV